MNNTPPSADLSKLKSILGNAKAIINKEGNVNSFNQDSRSSQPSQPSQPISQGRSMNTQDVEYLSEADMLKQGATPQGGSFSDSTRRPGQITKDAIKNSNMPEAVKKLMLEHPIAQPDTNKSFSLDDMGDLVTPTPQPQQHARITESVIQNNNDSFTVSESALRGIIKDVLVEYLTIDYSKNLTEATIKKTINTLIKEGKIKTKK